MRLKYFIVLTLSIITLFILHIKLLFFYFYFILSHTFPLLFPYRYPNIDLCGTPYLFPIGLDLLVLLILEICLRFVKYNLNHISSSFYIPYFISFYIRMSLSIISNARLKSRKIIRILLFFVSFQRLTT